MGPWDRLVQYAIYQVLNLRSKRFRSASFRAVISFPQSRRPLPLPAFSGGGDDLGSIWSLVYKIDYGFLFCLIQQYIFAPPPMSASSGRGENPTYVLRPGVVGCEGHA